MKTMPIPSVDGALAREDGMIKLPESEAIMPNGGVRAYKTKWIRGVLRKSRRGARHCYYGVTYRGKNYKIHRLVCEAFHGIPPKSRSIVLHLNESSTDNRPENLRWGTQKENLNAKGFIEYCRSRTGKNSPRAKGVRAKENQS